MLITKYLNEQKQQAVFSFQGTHPSAFASDTLIISPRNDNVNSLKNMLHESDKCAIISMERFAVSSGGTQFRVITDVFRQDA